MEKIKCLNLYSCLGGNRYKWTDCEVTAVELDPYLAEMYQERFPNDKVIVTDAHQYLLDHYQDFDFIWSSPPCPTHSRARFWGFGANGKNPVYPDMKLYQEIIFLQHHIKNAKWVVENVTPYYEPLIPGKKIGRHLYWSNFKIVPPKEVRKISICQGKNEINNLSEFHDYDFRKYKGEQRLNKIARNLVDYEVGLHIFNQAKGIIESNDTNQLSILDFE
jgi:DNA (cytosine-5)-methyltransferase 1